MDTTTALLLLAILICPIVMGLMMWKMNKNRNHSNQGPNEKLKADKPVATPEVRKKAG